ncbi:MAG: glucosidase [Ktedonobacteraceae bacterium]|nr:glucosidase [Ktedonobacteraceae bacterium]
MEFARLVWERERTESGLPFSGNPWLRWGPYLSERAWGTVREDYSADGNAWDYFPHDMARSRAYRWNEDGLAGISDDKGQLCFALALWNGRDPILKERLFGLSGPQGNHGEDVKEVYFYLDSTPTHSYMRMLYKYPQAAFPYQQLIDENRRRGKTLPEFELVDTGVFANDRYFDLFVEYAKADPDDILVRITAINRGPEAAPLALLPTLWFRNTWSWGKDSSHPLLRQGRCRQEDNPAGADLFSIEALHHQPGSYTLFCENCDELLFTENETNMQRLYGVPASTPYVKDAFHEYLIQGNHAAVNPARTGTKAAFLFQRELAAGATLTLRLRLRKSTVTGEQAGVVEQPAPFADFDTIFELRQREADEYYATLQPAGLDEETRRVQRQALAGMLWSKQFYHFIVEQWLQGDPTQPTPPPERANGRNAGWRHLYNERVMSMPDKWEYPWYASWDLGFHCLPLALVDSTFAKSQIDLLLREWYMHPNGQLPACEWSFDDVNPPVIAWAAWQVYTIDREQHGSADRMFLESVFHKLLLNFTWWVNRKDSAGKNIFQGGFLGLDNIGVFDRSAPLPTGGHLEQSDSTSWMGMFCLNMLTIALELALTNPVYEDIALKFFEHFLAIAAAMNNIAGEGIHLWDDEDEMFYDVLSLPDGNRLPLKIRSLVGLIPLCAVTVLEPEVLRALPRFNYHLTWYLTHRPELTRLVAHWQESERGVRRLLALVRGHRMKRLLRHMLDPEEFLSDYGIRSLSRYHAAHPYVLHFNGSAHSVAYEPAESHTGIFGGNSNWRGPIWFPINYLLIESLRTFARYYSDDFTVECPTGSGRYLSLQAIADELSQRLIRLFLPDKQGKRPCYGNGTWPQCDPHWRDYLLFHENFNGDTGEGLGANHQTGWTGLVAMLIQQQLKR